KNFIQRETLNFTGSDLESFCRFLAEKFLNTYPQTEGIQVSASEIPYDQISGGKMAFAPSGPERATARIELRRSGEKLEAVEASSGIQGFKLLRLGGSAFFGFVRDQYTRCRTFRTLRLLICSIWNGPTPPSTPHATMAKSLPECERS